MWSDPIRYRTIPRHDQYSHAPFHPAAGSGSEWAKTYPTNLPYSGSSDQVRMPTDGVQPTEDSNLQSRMRTEAHSDRRQLMEPAWYVEDHAWLRACSGVVMVEMSILYASFCMNGIQYGPGYRTLEHGHAVLTAGPDKSSDLI